MPDVLRTMDPVELSFGDALLRDAGIRAGRTEPEFGTSSEASCPFPGRLIVKDCDYERAVAILKEGFAAAKASTAT